MLLHHPVRPDAVRTPLLADVECFEDHVLRGVHGGDTGLVGPVDRDHVGHLRHHVHIGVGDEALLVGIGVRRVVDLLQTFGILDDLLHLHLGKGILQGGPELAVHGLCRQDGDLSLVGPPLGGLDRARVGEVADDDVHLLSLGREPRRADIKRGDEIHYLPSRMALWSALNLRASISTEALCMRWFSAIETISRSMSTLSPVLVTDRLPPGVAAGRCFPFVRAMRMPLPCIEAIRFSKSTSFGSYPGVSMLDTFDVRTWCLCERAPTRSESTPIVLLKRLFMQIFPRAKNPRGCV